MGVHGHAMGVSLSPHPPRPVVLLASSRPRNWTLLLSRDMGILQATNYTVAVLDDVRIPLTRYLVFDKEGWVLDEEGRVQWCTHFKTILFKSIVEMRPDQLVTNNKLLGISVGYFCSNKR